jgi:uncharacterized protein (DUF362 family)
MPPFHPPDLYPELRSAGFADTCSGNLVYAAVRDTLMMLGLDGQNFGTPHWNPLGGYIRLGDTVVIKPNFVLHEFGRLKGSGCLTTHPSVLRAMIDYAYIAGGQESSITIADAPIQGADFEHLLKQSRIHEIQEYYRRRHRYEIQVQDLRQVCAIIDEPSSLIKRVKELPGDSMGYRVIDMGKASRLSELDTCDTKYVVGDYDSNVTNTRHNRNRHQYVVSNTVLNADTIINLPKLKTHSKVGVTACLKNLVGIIGAKDCLPHHRHGKANRRGDEFPADYPMRWYASQRAYSTLQGKIPVLMWRTVRFCASKLLKAGTSVDGEWETGANPFFGSGGWHGNDTIWRTVDDLNQILFYYNTRQARFVETPQRRYFALVDGIVGMEGDGPLRGKPKPCGVLLAGDDPLAVDVVAATLMGFDWQRVHKLAGIAEASKYSGFSGDESQIEIMSNAAAWQSLEKIRKAHLHFLAPAGWRHYLEA